MKLKKGDYIKCSDAEEAADIADSLSKEGIKWDFVYKKDGAYHKPTKPSTFNNFEQREETDYDRQVREMMKAQRGDKK